MNNPITELPTQFTRRGNTYTQLAQTPAGYIYQVNDDDNFEVFKRIVKPVPHWDGDGFAGLTSEYAVAYPGESQWGTSAWTFLHIDSARKRLQEITATYNNSKVGVGLEP